MKYITHPYIRPESLEERSYQVSIAMKALEGNTMVVLPTGLGKTAIALLVAASRLYNGGGRVLVLAPTKPLVEQHLRFFQEFLRLPESAGGTGSLFTMFTGETPPEERAHAWKTSQVCFATPQVCFATPQVIKNDCIGGRYSIEDVSLLVVDECHRAVGNYAYVFIADLYLRIAKKPLLLAMTASPGADPVKVEGVSACLGIDRVESRIESDPDVKPYVHEREVEYVSVALPPELQETLTDFTTLVSARLQRLARLGFAVPKPERLSIRALSALNGQIQGRIAARDPGAYTAASLYAECMKLRHAISLCESQGSGAVKAYLARLASEGSSGKASKASRRLSSDPLFRNVVRRAEGWTEELHPKAGIIISQVREHFEAHPDSRIIIFATYRDSVMMLVDRLTREGITCEKFVGQANRDAEKGLSQKKQLEALSRFRAGEFRVLIATSVGEEGLDIPSTDMVIFYEAVPSEIRSIQRKGRTGRSRSGKILVLVTKGTSDEAFRYVSQRRERSMVSGIRSMSGQDRKKPHDLQATPVGNVPAAPQGGVPASGQTGLDTFLTQGPRIVVDDRETSSRVVETLHTLGVDIELRRLDSGDYAIGDRILVERKSARDFMDTLVNRDIFGQIKKMAEAVPRPVLIIEGREDLYSVRNIHPNAIRGTLAAIAVDMGVTLFFTADGEETANMLYVLARREEGSRGERKLHPRKSYRSLREEQEYVLASFPGIGLKNARLLLEHFGSIKAVIDAGKEDLVSVKGIGEKTASRIRDLTHRPYS